MKMTQQNNEFSPIALILETKQDAETFWNMMLNSFLQPEEQKFANKINNWFSNEAHL